MCNINFYHVRSGSDSVWSLRIKDRVFVLRYKKRKLNFNHYKLEYLDVLGFYYEIGWIKNVRDTSKNYY